MVLTEWFGVVRRWVVDFPPLVNPKQSESITSNKERIERMLLLCFSARYFIPTCSKLCINE